MDFDTSSLATKRNFVALKAEVDKLNKLVNVPIGLNNLKNTYLKVDGLDNVSVDCYSSSYYYY